LEICETVMEATTNALRRARDEAGRRAGLVELRLDALQPGELDVAAALEGRSCRVVVTCRPTWEGGKFDGAEEDRLRVLKRAAELGAEFVDVEWKAIQRLDMVAPPTRVVVSHHEFAPGVPADLESRLTAMRREASARGADSIVKIAIMAAAPRDCAVLRRLVFGRMSDTAIVHPTIAIAMGPAGVLSRTLPAKFSSAWTYAGSAAPGQMTVAQIIDQFAADRVSPRTRVFGIAGKPLAHSASPAMHMSAFRAEGVDAVFVPVETCDADELADVADALDFEGLSVTAPLKTAVLSYAAPDDAARAIGAVNTLRRDASGWQARNYDAPAFRAPLESRGLDLAGKRAVVLGAGGAARAAVAGLVALGARVEIAARNAARAAELAAALSVSRCPWPPSGRAAIVVNATPVGTSSHIGTPDGGEATPIPAGALSVEAAYDLVYNPPDTVFLQHARAAGAKTIGGLEMLVAQASRQFEWWTGRRVASDVFERAAREFIQ
jgi:3-dehydroquinate dehydratase/shikimate dehydrogenase